MLTTEELEKKLKISEKTCIHCNTLELAKQVLNIFHQLGLKWCDETHYTLDLNWDSFKENTVYYPFDGEISSLISAHSMGYKIIKAKEFIALHTEKEKFDLENYEPKGELEGFPKEIIARMLDCQEEQGNPRNVTVFEREVFARQCGGGFTWNETKEGWEFWYKVISYKNFDIFFEKYTKQEYQELKNNKNMQENNKKEDNSQEFRIGDKIIDIILDLKGKITNVKSNGNVEIQFEGESSITEYNLKIEKRPSLLHYRDDYNYDVIDFNNLPERQEAKRRWRAKEGWTYYSFTFDFKVVSFYDTRRSLDNKAYESGNYFQTKEEAQEVADKLNEYFQNIIKRIGEIYYSFTPNFEVEYFYDDDDIFDKKAYKLGNYFKTKEEAQEVADKLNKYLQELLNK